ncbi:hypothetical protein [Pedobacter sp. Leaf170]|uniref:hypothetical protein n=1 Tax=Pedobacter sp. Leaf170 TaxID=2876558 RepID=UPI001E287D4A|nr:hypothetical protein [Pedobacter sp. Leaf170]
MKNTTKATAATTNDNRFEGVDHRCLLPGEENVKCDHWGCKVTAKLPHYYPGWKKFFEDRGTTRFHVHHRDLSRYTKKQLASMPKEAKEPKAWLTPMPAGDGDQPNLNTGWIVEAAGLWPDRSIYNANEVEFIHVEYQTIRSKSEADIQKVIANGLVGLDNYSAKLNQVVTDVKEVVIYAGKEAVNG